ncbi:signal peptidase II, partial [Candidatus Woesearchaeota archaeon]|nr:signal peptidase II [Candidatus Woesearchaeota archaeon]
DERLLQISFGLVIGGTLGNLIDRIFLGYVVDFISFSFWPAFNIADSALTVGSVMLVAALFKRRENRA